MRHFTTPAFWQRYSELPLAVQRLADRAFELLRADARHRSLHFKKIGKVWSARVGSNYRALATERAEGLLWFWIGPHAEYERLISQIG